MAHQQGWEGQDTFVIIAQFKQTTAVARCSIQAAVLQAGVGPLLYYSSTNRLISSESADLTDGPERTYTLP